MKKIIKAQYQFLLHIVTSPKGIRRIQFSVLTLIMIGLWIPMGSSQSIDQLLTEAYRNNPSLKQIELEYESAMETSKQVNQLPDPSLGVGLPILRPETRLGGQVLSISASQMFPWFGTLDAREDVVISMAKAKYERLTAVRLNIDYQIKTAYYQVLWHYAQQDILQHNLQYLESLKSVTLAKVEAGQALASDVLSIDTQIESLQNQVKILTQEIPRFFAQINEMRNVPSTTPIEVENITLTMATIDKNLEGYRLKIADNHPLIKQIDWNINTAEKEILLNNLNQKPSLGIGLDYSMVSARTDANPIHNGRDILIPKLMISLPLNKEKYRAKERTEKLKQQAYEWEKEGLTNALTRQIMEFLTTYETAKLNIESIDKRILLAKSSYDILLAEFSSKGRRFDEVLKLRTEINQLEIQKLAATVQTQFIQFKIDQLTHF